MSTLLDTQVEALGWTLLHSLWQGAALWMALEAALAWPGLKSPRVRGRLAGGALLLFVLAVAGTYGWVARDGATEAERRAWRGRRWRRGRSVSRRRPGRRMSL